jgi:pimeloyl-ACP methyl ester carboxylesterase
MSITVDGLGVSVSTGGVDPSPLGLPVVLVHGAGMDQKAWRYQTRRLAHAGYRPLAVDLPGHGRSEGDPLPTIEEMGAWLLRFLDATDCERAAVLGLSMGSLVALEAAGIDPDRVVGIGLLGVADAMPVNPKLMEAVEAGDERAVAMMVAWSHSRAWRSGAGQGGEDWQRGAVARILSRGLRRSLASDLMACARYEVSSVASRVVAPALIVVGTEDRLTPGSAARRLAQVIGTAEVVEIPAGHFALLEDATLVQQVILDWLGRLPGS